MRNFVTVLIGKTVRTVARLRGGGSALPGLVVEKIDPGFLARALGRLPHGVVAVSGTNGKTTTTKMIVEMLEAQGLRVFTNRTGSNFSRGVVAAIVQEGDLLGRLDADIAVLELDEAHAVHFVKQVKPRITLLLNVLRDQLDRFGEIDTTARLLTTIAENTTETLVVNREDALVRQIGERFAGTLDVRSFGLSAELLATFPSDADFHRRAELVPDETLGDADVTLVGIADHSGTFRMDGAEFTTGLELEGLYNTFNAAAALALVRAILGGTTFRGEAAPDNAALIDALSRVRPAFGRGERLILDGQPFDLVLVKNPSGFRLALASFAAPGVAAMIAINDNYADGRDMSWLWDVDFSSLAESGVDTVTGVRAWDMALRLEHDDVPVARVEEDLSAALAGFRERTPGQPRRVYCTYTAMLALRKELSTLTDVEDIW